MDGKNNIKERATPPVQKKIAGDTRKRVAETVEKVYQDLDRAGFDRNDGDVKRSVRDGLELAWDDERRK